MKTDSKIRTRYHRAWPLLTYALLCYFLTGTVSGIMNVAPPLLHDAYGWDETLLISSMSVAALANVVTGFIAGRMSARRSAKPLCFAWGGIYITGLLVMGLSPVIGLFIVAMVLVSAASSAWGYNTVPVLITNWFPEKKGRVQGLVSTGLLLGSINPMIYNWAVVHWGLSLATVPFALLGAVALLLLALGVSDRPEERGLEPDSLRRLENVVVGSFEDQGTSRTARTAAKAAGGNGKAGEEGAGHRELAVATPSQSEMARRLLRSPRFILCSLVMGVQLIFAGGLMVQLVPRLTEIGFPLEEAMLVMVVASLFGCLGSIAFGFIGDKLGADVGVVLTYAAGVVAILLNVSEVPALVYLSVALIGCVVGTADNWPVSVCAEQFGRANFAAAFGVMFPVIQLVGAVGPAFFAVIAHVAGGYTLSYLAGGALMFVAMIAYLALAKTKHLDKNVITFE